ncbi:uncharacterized protein PHACADRAFT_253679 [Phanerochaete carnosa HHB-10118-sp]|uniref:Signal recognition particle SRP19 subunit n=1 Tax=Phanerochaete carnosa (strain HHB-10118-sp) TaxID=650164 RepID=K5VY55_PHACS|nr:uncharacterized protein PHACADRAFT_253679 [Phanerochaete carnosa HHB-10118-sp]EKM56508.1 hypothetical protein PHACADRAFT_253679 [Phanerochaete carnosa HHB-10118-sp]
MSRRAVVVEDFDDDTDLPLPNRVLPNTGAQGAILEALSDDEDGGSEAGPATPSYAHFQQREAAGGFAPAAAAPNMPKDGAYLKWTCIYPIYIDAKRPYGTGERRIARQKAVWWPLSRDIAEAASRLGLGVLHEGQKAHPRDWENPGRVRVQWKKDGRLMNPSIKTKKQLLELISMQIQMQKPDHVPKLPYSFASDMPAEPAPAPTPSKGKQPASKTVGKGTTAGTTLSPAAASLPRSGSQILPLPPAPHPPLPNRVSPYSPALVSGILVETVKAGMSAPDPMANALGGGGKGKRKVVRVRQ